MNLNTEIQLPCGQVLPNRLAKSAMSENMARLDHAPGPEFFALYQRWAKGGVGLCITGNVMVDSTHLGEPKNIVIEKDRDNLLELKTWASAKNGTSMKLWVQLNHPGKQSPKFLNSLPVAPSALALQAPLNRLFNTPKELNESEIQDIISRFAYAAKAVKGACFDGVQIHGAHGYLVSQFLSPKDNQRTDQWGGSLENRMRFVCELYQAIRAEVGSSFPIGIKLNSADFQRGGFTAEDSVRVAEKLSELGMDLIELSGGTYERPVMVGPTVGRADIKESTQKREGYFLEYAKAVRKKIKCPLMVTGGFRTGEFMSKVLENGDVDLVGLARPLAVDPDFPLKLLGNLNVESQVRSLTTGSGVLDKVFPLEIIWYTRQLQQMGRGREPNLGASIYASIASTLFETGLSSFRKVRR
jgi:2,4-dienoyl-CoA reductase-like NADH-dependent reductase (Old Yellow Enzyme family)